MNIPAFTHHVGSTERTFVAHVNDLNDFYLNSESIHDSLVNLGKDLYNEYSQSYTESLGNNKNLKIGDYCACPSESEDWYRGLIRQIDNNGHAMVFKIDNGDVQCIPIQFLRPLKERFFRLQRLATHCSLVNLVKPNDGWSSDTIEEFRSRLTTTFLYAKFINYNEIRDISEVEITEKSSKTPLNRDFESLQLPRSTKPMNDKLLYKYIPMQTLDLTQSSQIRLLYYISPARFYVYLQEKSESHLTFQSDLQKEVQGLRSISTPQRYQQVAVQDNHAVWHRAIVLDSNTSTGTIYVFMTDVGQRERIPMDRICQLPEGFQYNPAFAIPCCLNNVCPLNGTDSSVWKAIDPVHEEFNRLMVNGATCQVRDKQDLLFYTVDIEILKLGDLSTFLVEKNLVSQPNIRMYQQRTGFSSGQGSNESYIRQQLHQSGAGIRPPQQRIPPQNDYNPNSNNIHPQQTSRMPTTGSQAIPRQPPLPSNVPTAAASTPSAFPVLAPQDGAYKIIQVRNATEFYGLSQARENEFVSVSQNLDRYYNNDSTNTQFGASMFLVNDPYVIQHDDQYHRVVMKRRESDTRIFVKLVDRGDEILVDTTELLNIDPKFCSIPEFAQPFRLEGFDESNNTATITSNLKKMITNQMVAVKIKGSMIKGFYPVEVKINDRSVNQALLSNEKIPPMSLVTATSRQNNTNPQPPIHFESKVFTNSSRYHSTNPGISERSDPRARPNDVLQPPQKMLTGSTRPQTGRFGDGPPSNEPQSRVSTFNNPNQRSQPNDSSSSNNAWNSDRNNQQNYNNTGGSNQPSFGRQQSNPSQFNQNSRPDENRSSEYNNSGNQQRPSGGGFGQDERDGRSGSGFSSRGGFNNDRSGSNNDRSGFNNDRGGSNNDRGGYNNDRGGFNNDRSGSNNDRGGFNNDRSGFNNDRSGFNNDRSGFNNDRGGFNNDRGGFNNDRGGFNNDRGGSNNDRGGFNNDRSGFNNDRSGSNNDRGGFNNDRSGFNNDRGGFSNDRSGFNNDRGGFRNDRGGRGGFSDRNTGRNNQENQENNSQFERGFSRGGGRGGGFSDRGGRGGDYQDRNNFDRNSGGDRGYGYNSDRGRGGDRGRGYNNDRGRGGGRGGYQNRDEQGYSGNFRERGDRDGSRGGFGGNQRGGFRNNANDDIQLSSDTTGKSFSGWSSTQSTSKPFEAGDRFADSSIPSPSFKYVVSHIETANQFYIQLLSKGAELSTLTEQLQTEYKQAPEVNISSFEVNQPCLAKFTDQCWYRATVLTKGVTQLKVRFVDFGNTCEVDSKNIRQISKTQSVQPPYAYQCTFENAQAVENVDTDTIINQCANKEFEGKIATKTSDGKFFLQSDEWLNLLLKINAIKVKSEKKRQRIKCSIGHIESAEQKFFIQDDEKTLNEIADLIAIEEPNAVTLSLDEVKNLEGNTIIIAQYEETPYRGIIQSDESDADVNICFVDYGNINACPKDSLKQSSDKLSSYPYQAKHCRLYGVSTDKINEALEYLGDQSDSEIEISIVKEKDQIYDVLIYINDQCINENFGYDPNEDEEETTVQEQQSLSTESKEQKTQDAEPTDEDNIPKHETPAASNEDVVPEDTTPAVSQQSDDEVDLKDEILAVSRPSNEDAVPKTETPLSAQPSEREEFSSKYHRGTLAHIDTNKPYVYIQLSLEMLDQINGLIDNVRQENKHNASYEIGENVVAKFSTDGDYYRARIESKSSTSDSYNVYFLDYGNLDENVLIDDIHPYTDQLKEIEPLVHGYALEGISSDAWNESVRSLIDEHLNNEIEFYYTDEDHLTIHIKFENENDIYHIEQGKTFEVDTTNKENDVRDSSDENLEERLTTCSKEGKDSWSINELCLVSNDEGKYLRGEILVINDDNYDVKCIDHGYNLSNIPIDRLYVLPDEEIFKQPCRKDPIEDETKPESDKEEIIAPIPDESCEKFDSTNQTSLLSITNNQTIDFGENDPSTTIKDETNNSFLSN